MAYRTYTKADAIEADTTLEGAIKHNTRFADIKTWFPDSAAAAQHQSLLLNAALDGFTFSHIFRSNRVFEFDGSAPTAGQLMQFDGDGTVSAVSASLPTAYVEQTTNFNVSDNGRFACDTSGGAFNAALTSAVTSVDFEFILEPTDNADFETNAVTVTRFSTETIANDAANFVCDKNGQYHFKGNTSGNIDVFFKPVLRST